MNPHPYDRINLIAGVKGIFPRLSSAHLLRRSERGGVHRPSTNSRTSTSTPLWKHEGELARKLGGHGGMDFLMVYRLIECMRIGLAPDLDVYDAAAWSAPGPLSEASVTGQPADCRPRFHARTMEGKARLACVGIT